MSHPDPTYDQLMDRLARAEATLEALRKGELDLLVGPEQPLVVRLRSLEQRKARYQSLLDTVRSVNRAMVQAASEADLLDQAAAVLAANTLIHGVWLVREDHAGRIVHVAAGGIDAMAGPQQTRQKIARAMECRQKVRTHSVPVRIDAADSRCAACPLAGRLSTSSRLAARLAYGHTIFGTMGLYASQQVLQDPDVEHLLADLAADLAAGLDRLTMEKRRRRLETAIDQADEGIAVLSPQARVRWANGAFCRLLGLDRQRVYDTILLPEHAPDHLLPLTQKIASSLQGRCTWSGRLEVGTGGRRPLVLGGTISPTTGPTGADDGAVVILNDVTELVSMQRQVHQAQKMESIGRLAGGIAHDFNNMLSVMGGYAELALGKVKDHLPLRADLEQIRSAAERAGGLVRKLLSFSRRQPVEPRPIELSRHLADAHSMLRRLIDERIRLDIAVDDTTWPVFMDPVQLDQVLLNLVVNARDAIAGAGTITIRAANKPLPAGDLSAGKDCVAIEVSDTGCGIAPADLERIFEPFFTTKKGAGTGLGLATVYSIVRQNGGRIEVGSRPGKGTAFTIFLPPHRHADRSAPGAEPIEATATKTAGTVLLVEDESQVRRMTCAMLQRLGYRVLEAARPSEAVALARDHEGPVDVLLTDMVMPEMNGLELAEQIRALCPDAHILIMTGYSPQAVDLGDSRVRCLKKPFTMEELARFLQGLDDARRT